GWPAARLAGTLTAALAPLVAGSPRRAARIWLRDARGHPSPNAGVVEAACAGALGVRLGGRTPYRYGVQMRPVPGDGPEPRRGGGRGDGGGGHARDSVRSRAASVTTPRKKIRRDAVSQLRSRSACRNARRRSASSRCP